MKPIEQLFWSKVDIRGPDECWEWQAGKFTNGYGAFHTGIKRGLSPYVHRCSWVLSKGSIPDNLQVLHRCDNRPCCNPKHLFLGTHQDNMDDMKKKGRADTKSFMARGSKNSRSKLTEEEVIKIRRDTRTQKEIAKTYNVARTVISHVKLRKTWNHI